MSVQVEKLEKNMAKLTVEVSTEDFKAAIKKAYNKTKNRFAIPGFRKRARLPRASDRKDVRRRHFL
ncbi:MAG: trigger factor family protein [Enterocloster sp.]